MAISIVARKKGAISLAGGRAFFCACWLHFNLEGMVMTVEAVEIDMSRKITDAIDDIERGATQIGAIGRMMVNTKDSGSRLSQ